MAHSSHWVIDKRVLRIKYTGNITKEELGELNTELTEYLEYGEAPIHIISDNSEMERLDINIKTFRSSMMVMNDKRWGWTMLVGAETITKFFGRLISNTFRLKLKLVDTDHQARYAIQTLDTTIINLVDQVANDSSE